MSHDLVHLSDLWMIIYRSLGIHVRCFEVTVTLAVAGTTTECLLRASAASVGERT